MADILEKIYRAELKFLAPLSLEQTYQTIVKEAIKLVDADNGVIHLMKEGEFEVIYASQSQFYSIKPRPNGNVFKAFSSQKAILATDISDIKKTHPEMRKSGLRTAIFIPLSYQKENIGVLAVTSKRSQIFDKGTLRILTLFGSIASLAVRKTQLYEETQKALETRDLFISMAAHELKTPLTSISGYSQLLFRKFSKSEAPEGRWVKQLSWELLRLTYLVKELLHTDSVESGELQYFFKECSLDEITSRVVANFRLTHSTQRVSYKPPASKSDIVIGDYDKLIQVLTNILDNAAQASPANSKLSVNVNKKGSNFTISIKDQGHGIPTKDIPLIFNRFHRGSNNSREGMGLGLYLVQDIMKRHRGKISVSSIVNKGTTFTLTIPGVSI